jgi:hypothetical protein
MIREISLHRKRGVFALLLLTICKLFLPGQVLGQASRQAIMPPELKWSGKSQALVVAKNDAWITPAEQSDLTRTPRYDETVKWLQKLVAAAPELKMISLGKSPEGRDIWMVIASKERAFTPAALRATGKPIFLAQAGIHSGEIDGKDAGMMLLRDMTVAGKKRDLLDGANLLFIPILSVDAHERFSTHGRINQRGPIETGWRTNARNLNLNRDYAKRDTPELRALIRAINEWNPDLYFDLHVTDGADYQYDITFGCTGKHGYSPAIATWLDEALRPHVERDLKAMGHIPGPLVFPVNGRDFQQGIIDFTAGPRFSNAYGDARHLPTVLVENHSLKPIFTVYNNGGSVLTVTGITADKSWLSASPSSFTVAPGGSQLVQVAVIWSQLTSQQSGNLSVMSNDPANPVSIIQVTAIPKLSACALVWQASLTIRDAGNNSGTLSLGQGPTATNDIDADCGEQDLPPLPPSGVFDARFELPVSPPLTSLADYRSANEQMAVWRLKFQPGVLGPITFSWNPADFPSGNFVLKDEIVGTIVNVDMTAQNNFTLTNPAISSLQIELTRQISRDVSVNSGWNIISVPLIAANMAVSSLFPDAASRPLSSTTAMSPPLLSPPARVIGSSSTPRRVITLAAA